MIAETVLAKFILCEDSWRETSLTVDDFRKPKHQHIFDKIMELGASGEPVNMLSVYVAVDGYCKDFVLTCPEKFEDVHVLALDSLERKLREENTQHLLADLIKEHGTKDPHAIYNALGEFLNKPEEAGDLEDIFSKIFQEYEFLSQNPSCILGLSSGLESLDKVLGGFRKGELYIIAARPSMGKSAFATNLALNAVKSGKRVYLQALEETKSNIVKRMTANMTGISIGRLMSGDIRSNEWSKIIDAHDRIKKLNIHIDDESSLSSMQITNRIRKNHNAQPIDLVIVDHLQEIYDIGQNRHLAISAALHNIKSTCKNLGIPCIVLAQVNREVEKRSPPRPIMSDLKESGDIEAKADAVIMLYRPGYYDHDKSPNDLKVCIAKNRNGETKVLDMHFDGAHMRITETEDRWSAVGS